MLDTPRFDAIDTLDADELRQRLRSLQALIASAPVPIAIAHDPDCRFISANLALATLLGVPLGCNISMTPADGSPPHTLSRLTSEPVTHQHRLVDERHPEGVADAVAHPAGQRRNV